MSPLRLLLTQRQLDPTLSAGARCVRRIGHVLYLYAKRRQPRLRQTQVAQSTGHKVLEAEAGTWRELVGILTDGLLRDSGACRPRELRWRKLVGRSPSSCVVFRPGVSAPQAGWRSRRRLADDLRAQTVTGLGRVVLLVVASIVQVEPILGSGRRFRCYRCRRGDGVCAWMHTCKSMSTHLPWLTACDAVPCVAIQCNASIPSTLTSERL